ncbi:MAG: hypothetical protein MJ250_07495 [Alphaproteobacteria bacterium]|nr:hypothetical protein [Alphaproteobacteria bacterium]
MTNENEQILTQQRPLIKLAKRTTLLWLIFVIVPSTFYFLKNANHLEQYGIVFSVSKINDLLEDQYNSLSDKTLDKVNLDKYIAKISIPMINFEKELKLDTIENISKQTKTAKKVTSSLSKLGIKQVSDIDKNLDSVQKKIDSANEKLKASANKLNTQIENTTKQIKSTITTDLKSGLKTELSSLVGDQIKNQFNLNDKLYTALKEKKFGLKSQNTASIYNALKAGGIFKKAISNIDKHFYPIKVILLFAWIILLLLPPVIFFIIAKILSSTYVVCPYCNKTFKKGF